LNIESEERQKLDRSFVGGLAWTAGAKSVTQLVTWASVLIAAKLLSPSDFGAVELAGFVTVLTNVLAEFGIGSAVLQMRDLDRRTLAQLNSVSLIFSTIAFIASCAITPLVAAFFRTDQLIPLMIVNNMAYFITGFQAVPMGLLERDMDYRKMSLSESASGIVQSVVTVGCALAGMGYWSLLAGPMAGKATTAGLIVFWKPLPFAVPRRAEVASAMHFGFKIALSRLAWTAYSQADTIIIGRVLGQSALGAYRMAISIASLPSDRISMMIMRVTGPLFARVQSDLILLRRYFLFISDALALVNFPLAFGLIVVAPDIVTILGPQWKAAIVPMQWLAAYMVLRTLSTLISQILISLHFASFTMWMSFFTVAVMPAAFYVAAHKDAGTVAMTWLLMSPVILLPPAVKLLRALSCSFREYLAVLSPAIIASAAMTLGVWAERQWLIPDTYPAVWRLMIQMITGGIIYGGILLLFYRPLMMRYFHFAMRLRSAEPAAEPMADLL